MVDKAELMDLNERIEEFEKIAVEFAEVAERHFGDAEEIYNLARKMEMFREKFDRDLKEEHLHSLVEDAKALDSLDEAVDKHIVSDLKEEARAIDQEIKDIVEDVQS